MHNFPLYNVPQSKDSKGPSAMVLCRLAVFTCTVCPDFGTCSRCRRPSPWFCYRHGSCPTNLTSKCHLNRAEKAHEKDQKPPLTPIPDTSVRVSP